MQVGTEPNRQNDRVNNHLGWEGKIKYAPLAAKRYRAIS